MNRTKLIYFLSSFVLIIGCFALNESYSLFIETETKDAVSSSVPNLNGELSLSSVEVEANTEYLIKQTITNTGTGDMNYALNTSSTSKNYTLQAVTDGTNIYLSTGTLLAGESYTTYLVVKNNDTETITIDFTLNKKYTTLNNDLTTNINNTDIYSVSVGGLPYSDKPESLAYKLIEKQVEKFGGASSGSGIDSLFSESINKILLPLSGSELEVPSPTSFTGDEKNEVGLYAAEDDYGTSYYYRGANSYNYVNFAGFTWRIVRINGDGSIRLILDGSLDKVKKDGVAVYTNSNLKSIDSDGLIDFNASLDNDNAYVGYMYGEFTGNSTSYDKAHQNKNNSTIKTYVDEFYKEYLLSYQDNYIADTLFCGDKTFASSSIGLDNKRTGFGTGSENITFYAASERLYYIDGLDLVTTAKPTLECASSENATDTLTEEQRAYSRYTSSKIDISTTTTKGILVNNDLEYPIGLLSVDEVVFAGLVTRGDSPDNYYLNDAYSYVIPTLYNYWWTMSPIYFFDGAGVFYINSNNGGGISGGSVKGISFGVRPVINLKTDILWNSGEGTYGSPYTVKVS